MIGRVNRDLSGAVELESDEAAVTSIEERVKGQCVLGALGDVNELRQGGLAEPDAVERSGLVNFERVITTFTGRSEGVCGTMRHERSPGIEAALKAAVLICFVRCRRAWRRRVGGRGTAGASRAVFCGVLAACRGETGVESGRRS